MDRLLATILSIGYNWNRREFRRFRNCALALTVLPLGMLLGAAALGGIAWQYKLIAIELAWLIVLYATIVFGWRRLPFVVEVGTLLAASDPDPKAKDRKFTGDVRVSVTEYLRLVMAVLASQTAAGFITLWLPVHANVSLALLGLSVGMAFVAYWIWQQGETWWPKLVWWLTFFTALFALVGLTVPYYFPQTTSEVVSDPGRFDGGLAALIRGQATPQTVFWVIFGLLLVQAVLPAMLKAEAWSVVRKGMWLLVLALLTSWFIWGSGWALIKERVESPLASAAVPTGPTAQVQLHSTEWRQIANVTREHVRKQGGCVDLRIIVPMARWAEVMFSGGQRFGIDNQSFQNFGEIPIGPVFVRGERGPAQLWVIGC